VSNSGDDPTNSVGVAHPLNLHLNPCPGPAPGTNTTKPSTFTTPLLDFSTTSTSTTSPSFTGLGPDGLRRPAGDPLLVTRSIYANETHYNSAKSFEEKKGGPHPQTRAKDLAGPVGFEPTTYGLRASVDPVSPGLPPLYQAELRALFNLCVLHVI
jgi:hypothetical protein